MFKDFLNKWHSPKHKPMNVAPATFNPKIPMSVISGPTKVNKATSTRPTFKPDQAGELRGYRKAMNEGKLGGKGWGP